MFQTAKYYRKRNDLFFTPSISTKQKESDKSLKLRVSKRLNSENCNKNIYFSLLIDRFVTFYPNFVRGAPSMVFYIWPIGNVIGSSGKLFRPWLLNIFKPIKVWHFRTKKSVIERCGCLQSWPRLFYAQIPFIICGWHGKEIQ